MQEKDTDRTNDSDIIPSMGSLTGLERPWEKSKQILMDEEGHHIQVEGQSSLHIMVTQRKVHRSSRA